MNENSDFERYSRQIFIDEIGPSGQKKIKNASVLIIGLGGLGSPVLQYLAAAGIGKIGLVENDIVELHNLNRQIIHQEKFIGKSKMTSAIDAIKRLNSQVQIEAFDTRFDQTNAHQLIKKYSVVVDASDNFETRFLVNDACVELVKPLVFGSISHFEGQVAVFNYQGSKHLRDLFATIPTNIRDNCDSKGVLGPLPGAVGCLMSMQVLKIITGLPVDTNTLLVMNLYQWTFDKVIF